MYVCTHVIIPKLKFQKFQDHLGLLIPHDKLLGALNFVQWNFRLSSTVLELWLRPVAEDPVESCYGTPE